MAVEIITSFGQQLDSSGNPISGARIYVYNVGTTTPRAVYSDDDLDPGDEAANPIVCDSAGRHDMRWTATGSYKIVVKTSADVTVYTRDEIDGRVPVGSGALAIANGGTGATSAGAAIAALGAASAAELADVAADVAAVVGALGSTEKTHIATGSTAQRPAVPVEGDLRRNSENTEWEGYNNSAAWEIFLTNTNVLAKVRAAIPATTFQYLTSGTGATYTTPSNPAPRTLRIRMVGGGGGGGGATSGNGSAGVNTLFNSIQANPGSGGNTGAGTPGAGGSAGGGSASIRIAGCAGFSGGEGLTISFPGAGGPGFWGGGGQASAAVANSGAGGRGGQSSGDVGAGGGAGEYVEFLITSPSASYTYTVGTGGAAGSGGASGVAGSSGLIIVEEYY